MLYIAIVLFVLVTTGLAVLAFENFLNDVSLSLVVWHSTLLPVGWLLLLAYFLGAVMLFLIAAAAAAQDARELRSLRERVRVLGERIAAGEAQGGSSVVPMPGMPGSKPDISDMTTLH
jgi:uncharacterized integral membrane protein